MTAYQPEQVVQIPIDAVQLDEVLAPPSQTRRSVVFARGSASRRFLTISLVALLGLVLAACS
jgi:hypothetical protein